MAIWTHAIGVEGQDELGALGPTKLMKCDYIRMRIKQAERRASQANHDLITSMSHDIRTPLATLKGYLEIFVAKKKGEEERQAFLYTNGVLKKNG
jgi:K+-sensing histidine kinase KdpD